MHDFNIVGWITHNRNLKNNEKFIFCELLQLLLISSAKGQIIGKFANFDQPDLFQFNADSTFRYEFHPLE